VLPLHAGPYLTVITDRTQIGIIGSSYFRITVVEVNRVISLLTTNLLSIDEKRVYRLEKASLYPFQTPLTHLTERQRKFDAMYVKLLKKLLKGNSETDESRICSSLAHHLT